MFQPRALLLSFFALSFPILFVNAVETCTSDFTACSNAAQDAETKCYTNLFTSCGTQQQLAIQQCSLNQNTCLATSDPTTCSTAYNTCVGIANSNENTCESTGYSACSDTLSTAQGNCYITESLCNSSPSALNTPCYNVQKDCVKGYSIVIACCNDGGGTDCSTLQSQYAANCQSAYSKAATTCAIGDDACCDSLYQSHTGTTKEEASSSQTTCQNNMRKRDELGEDRVEMMSKRRKEELLRRAK